MIDYNTLYEQTKTLSVLLVEDFEPLRREMVDILEDLFETVLVASDGEEALHLYKNANYSKIDLIISDIQMPNMDGVMLTRKIREINENQVIIILSAHTDSKYLLELINMGISKFLTKPIQQDDFFTSLYRESIKKNAVQKEDIDTLEIQLGENYVWHVTLSILKHNGIVVVLTKHELLMLQFFIKKIEQVCTSQNIIDYFDSQRIEISEKNIRNLVFKLRKKIPQQCVQNIYGLGYKFIVPLQ